MGWLNSDKTSEIEPYDLVTLPGNVVTSLPAESAFDSQVGGDHYKTLGIQPLELCYANRGYEAFSGSCYTKIVKYMDRKKDNEVDQLKKARHVLDMWIEKAEKENNG